MSRAPRLKRCPAVKAVKLMAAIMVYANCAQAREVDRQKLAAREGPHDSCQIMGDLSKSALLSEAQRAAIKEIAMKSCDKRAISQAPASRLVSGSPTVPSGKPPSPQPTTDPSASGSQKPPSLIGTLLPDPWRFAIAKDMTNIGILKFTDASTVTGATISYTDDRSAKDSSLKLQAVGTLGYQFLKPWDPKQWIFDYGDVGIYGGADKFTNSNNVNPKTRSSDLVKYGGFLELGVPFSDDLKNYARFRAGGVTNDIATRTLYTIGKNTVTTIEAASQFSGAVELIPAWNFGGHQPWEYLGFWGNMWRGDLNHQSPVLQLDPEVVFRYDNSFDTTKPLLFSNRSTASRLGPQMTVILTPFPDVPNLNLYGLTIQASYYYAHEFEADHNAYTFSTSLNYPLSFLSGDPDKKGLALSVSYQRGANVDTGQNQGLFSIGISGQICTNCKSGS
jgi:hypothetical protein